MPSKTATIVVAATTLAAGAALSAAVPALAGLGGAETPGARAAAVVNGNGSVVRSTGITRVSRVFRGDYCIYVEPGINAAKAVPVAMVGPGAPSWDTTASIGDASQVCGDPTKAFRVRTGAESLGGITDSPFNVVLD